MHDSNNEYDEVSGDLSTFPAESSGGSPIPDFIPGEEVVDDMRSNEKQTSFLQNFLKNTQTKFMNQCNCDNQISDQERDRQMDTSGTSIVRVHNFEQRQSKLASDILTLTCGQLSCYNKAIRHLSGADDTQLIMFITGEGGTGKTYTCYTIYYIKYNLMFYNIYNY